MVALTARTRDSPSTSFYVFNPAHCGYSPLAYVQAGCERRLAPLRVLLFAYGTRGASPVQASQLRRARLGVRPTLACRIEWAGLAVRMEKSLPGPRRTQAVTGLSCPQSPPGRMCGQRMERLTYLLVWHAGRMGRPALNLNREGLSGPPIRA